MEFSQNREGSASQAVMVTNIKYLRYLDLRHSYFEVTVSSSVVNREFIARHHNVKKSLPITSPVCFYI